MDTSYYKQTATYVRAIQLNNASKVKKAKPLFPNAQVGDWILWQSDDVPRLVPNNVFAACFEVIP